MTTDLRHSYEDAYSSCVLIDRSDVTRLWANGRDRLDLLHRMSTNDLQHMAENEGRATVLTNALGRILDCLVTLNLCHRALMLGSPGRAVQLCDWLAKHIFFQDEVTIKDATGELGQFGLYGAKAASVAEHLSSGAAELPLYHALPFGNSWVVRVPDLAGGGWEVVAPRRDIESMATHLESFGAVPASRELYDLLRVEAGLPGAGSEISEAYIPLEVGLWDAVSFEKGCYIGQEIIARMESRGKLSKILIGLRSDSELLSGDTLRTLDGGRCGIVTSSVRSPRLGWIGMGLIKPSMAEPGAQLTVERNDGFNTVTVSALPFGS